MAKAITLDIIRQKLIIPFLWAGLVRIGDLSWLSYFTIINLHSFTISIYIPDFEDDT